MYGNAAGAGDGRRHDSVDAMAFLDELRARIDRTRGDDPAHAVAVLELAEAEPLLGNRIEPVRAAINAAAVVLDRVSMPELRARLLLRLAQMKIAETDFEGADQALAAVGDHVPDHKAIRFLTGIRACRVALRRGPETRTQAREMLLASAALLPQFDAEDPLWQRVATEIAIGIAELSIHDDPPDPSAFDPLRELIDELAHDPAQIDMVFVGRQLLATYAISIGDAALATSSLRSLIKIAQEAGSPTDEVEARLALAGVLMESADHVAHEEAAHHVHKARERAREHGLGTLQHAALIAEAGVLSRGGKTAGAIDRVLELARTAVADKDVPRYVAAVGIMAELYARSGDVVSAFRTIVESNRALSDATGSDATALFRPHLAALRDRIGSERLEQIAADVAKANQLASELSEKSPSNPS